MKIERTKAVCAYEVMTHPVETVRTRDSIHEVARLFTENHIGAAAVTNDLGKPVGVITKTDIVRYEQEKDDDIRVAAEPARTNGEPMPAGFHVTAREEMVEEWMTPVIFCVKPETPLKEVARRMVKYGVHHIFVQRYKGEPILGIVSSFDVLRQVASDSLVRAGGRL